MFYRNRYIFTEMVAAAGAFRDRINKKAYYSDLGGKEMEPKGKALLKGAGIIFLIWGILITIFGVVLFSTATMLQQLGDSHEIQQIATEGGLTMEGLVHTVNMMSVSLIANGACIVILGILGIIFCKSIGKARFLRFLSILVIVFSAVNLGMSILYGLTAMIPHMVSILLGIVYFIGADRNVKTVNLALEDIDAEDVDILAEEVQKKETEEDV